MDMCECPMGITSSNFRNHRRVMRRVAKKLLNIYNISRLMGKRRYNPLDNLHGFVNLTNKKKKNFKLEG